MPDLPVAAGAVWVDRSGGGVEGDLVAQRFQLVDVLALATVDAEPVGVEVSAEVAELGVRMEQQVPDDGQDRAADRHQGLLGSAAAGQASVALAEEGLGAAGADCGLAEDAGEVAVAVPGAAGALLLPCGFLDPGGEARPRGEVGRRGKAGHVTPTSAMSTAAAVLPIPGIVS